MATIELENVGFKITDDLEKTFLRVSEKDLPTIVSKLSAILIDEQIKLGNPPTNILVDNRGRRPITDAKRRVQAFFTDKNQLKQAVFDAWEAVRRLTRIRSGRAIGTYEVWYNNAPIGRTPSAINAYIDKFNPAVDCFRIVGPRVVYGRKIHWNPKGAPKLQKRTVGKGKAFIVKLVRIQGIMTRVEQEMRRKTRAIAVAEDWVTTPQLPKDGRTPGLWIGFKKRGTLLRK